VDRRYGLFGWDVNGALLIEHRAFSIGDRALLTEHRALFFILGTLDLQWIGEMETKSVSQTLKFSNSQDSIFLNPVHKETIHCMNRTYVSSMSKYVFFPRQSIVLFQIIIF